MGFNLLGHFLMTNLLLDLKLKANYLGRIVVMSSELHKMHKIDQNDLMSDNDFSAYKAYARTKLAKELSKKLRNSKITVNSCHPGLVRTEISRQFNYTFIDFVTKICLPFGKYALQGAQT